MSLLTQAMKTCILLNKQRVSDGYGGFTSTWTDGPEFQAAIVFNTSLEARKAQKAGVTSLYTVTTAKSITLEYHDVFRIPAHTDDDGNAVEEKILRVTSDGDDSKTPASASLNMRQVTAEEWSLPDE